MKTHYMKIREKFISEVRMGNKRHEYRLATPERKKIKVGDVIVLVSNQNKKDYVRTTVKRINNYNGWKDAIEENWQDFSHIYSTQVDALKECYRFYPKFKVDTYGIIVFEVALLETNYSNMGVLLDTNIIIKRESSNNVSFDIASLFNWFGRESISTYIHSVTEKELSDYGDEKARTIMLTKLKSYDVLPSYSIEADDYFDSIVSKYSLDRNSKYDNLLLREIYDYNVDILLTDDTTMLKKAEDLYIRDRVLSSAEMLSYFEKTYPQNIEYKMLAVKLRALGEINLNSSFFDTLREDYGGKDFDDWFKNKALKGEKAYVFEELGELKGFLYLKIEDEGEDYSDIKPELLPKKRLKVGTFKIERTGFRLGERFLKIIFDNAKQYKVEEIYVTLFEDKREDVKYLKNIMENWGFYKHGYKANGESVLVKDLEIYKKDKDPKFNFPLLKDDAKYFFLPIEPQYHTDLFPDLILKNEDMHLYEENKAHRYALEKIYLSGAYNVKAKAGDIVLIYRKGERYPKKYSSVVTGIAVIEDLINVRNVEECISICKNRSIFTEEEIRSLYPKYTLIIKLLDLMAFKNKVTLNQLYENKIVDVNSGPRPLTPITKDQFNAIYKLGMEEE